MTCIVGVVIGDRVTIGGDSMGSAGCSYDLRRNPKVVRVGALIIGHSGAPRVGDVVQHWLDVPELDGDPMRYMVRVFVPSLVAALRAADFPIESKEDNDSWALLVGVGGRLFAVYDDLQVEETTKDYAVIGCAHQIALGALYTLAALGTIHDGHERAQLALEAAEAADAHVRAPFVILTSDGE